jgi:hypothetical protein
MLNREAILAQSKLPTEEVSVPEWGGSVTVRALTGAQRDAFEAGCIQQRGKKTERNLNNLRARLVALSVVDADGKRLFSDADAAALGELNAAALDRVYDAAARISGLNAKDQEELLGN